MSKKVKRANIQKTFWDKQPTIDCPLCGKRYKNQGDFFNHLHYNPHYLAYGKVLEIFNPIINANPKVGYL